MLVIHVWQGLVANIYELDDAPAKYHKKVVVYDEDTGEEPEEITPTKLSINELPKNLKDSLNAKLSRKQ